MRKFTLLCLLALTCLHTIAQSATCPDIVVQALEAVDRLCSPTATNQACYGNVQLQAELFPNSLSRFEQVGDISPIESLLRLDLSPLDETTGAWGVAVLQLQANVPNSLPGQNVTFVLFGDVSLENPEGDMQAFYLSTGIGDSACEEAPESGLLVQTPEGVSEIAFNINGVDVLVGSTVFFQALPDAEMRVTTLEGAAGIKMADVWFPIVAGTRVRLAVDADLNPLTMPQLPESYDHAALERLPLGLLTREISITETLEARQLRRLHQQLQNGFVPCGVEGLADCDSSSIFQRFEGKLPTSEQWGAMYDCPPCGDSENSHYGD